MDAPSRYSDYEEEEAEDADDKESKQGASLLLARKDEDPLPFGRESLNILNPKALKPKALRP